MSKVSFSAKWYQIYHSKPDTYYVWHYFIKLTILIPILLKIDIILSKKDVLSNSDIMERKCVFCLQNWFLYKMSLSFTVLAFTEKNVSLFQWHFLRSLNSNSDTCIWLGRKLTFITSAVWNSFWGFWMSIKILITNITPSCFAITDD